MSDKVYIVRSWHKGELRRQPNYVWCIEREIKRITKALPKGDAR